MRLSILVLLAFGVAACSDSTTCAPTAPCIALRSTADSLTGSWKEVETWNGVTIRMSLTARDSTLAGAGTYSDTSGASGTGQVTGFVFWQDSTFVPAGYVMPAHPVVVLRFAFSNGRAATFDQGVIEQQNTLSGVLTFADDSSASYGVHFVRTTP
jgi:hypothetical protein